MPGFVWSGRRLARGAALWLALMPTVIALRAQTSDTPRQATASAEGPAQPIPFSHRTHTAIGFDCLQCHSNPDGGTLMTYPPTAICMSCHQAVAADRPSIKKLAAFAEAGTPVPWVRVYAVADYVFWNHGAHLRAKVGCAECHGDVAQRDVVTQETDVVTMLGCQRCHDRRQAFTDCGDCHEPRR